MKLVPLLFIPLTGLIWACSGSPEQKQATGSEDSVATTSSSDTNQVVASAFDPEKLGTGRSGSISSATPTFKGKRKVLCQILPSDVPSGHTTCGFEEEVATGKIKVCNSADDLIPFEVDESDLIGIPYQKCDTDSTFDYVFDDSEPTRKASRIQKFSVETAGRIKCKHQQNVPENKREVSGLFKLENGLIVEYQDTLSIDDANKIQTGKCFQYKIVSREKRKLKIRLNKPVPFPY